MSTVTQGLIITVVGMGLVFLALGILLVAMTLLGRAFPVRAAGRRAAASPLTPVAAQPEETAVDLSYERAAAISVALARAFAAEAAPTPAAMTGPAGAWAAVGRSRELHAPRSREARR